MIPFVDLKRIHEPLTEDFVNSLKGILTRSIFINGPEVQEFEKTYAAWVGTRYCIGVSSGLDAVVIGLRTMGVGKGDRVIAPAMTYIATTEAITAMGAETVLVDVDKHGQIDLKQTEEALQKGAKFILPVHLYGQLVDPKALQGLAKKYGAQIFEDACQSHGARQGEFSAGTIGRAAAFSFFPGKNLGALGDGGAICTNDPEVDRMARIYREHGQTKKYYHEYEGYTGRLDTLHAAFLLTKMKHIDQWTSARIKAAKYYYEKLKDLSSIQLQTNQDFSGGHVYHLFVVLTEKRQALSEEFEKRGIGFGYHYPFPIHQQICYRDRGWNELKFPQAEKYATQGISIPLFAGITEKEMDGVIEAIQAVCK